MDEIARIREACGYHRFKEPLPYNGTKIDDFNDLLAKGESVAVSHVTFLNATPETIEAIREGGYTLILDEVLDVVCEFNKIQSVEDSPEQAIKTGDISMLFDKRLIEIEDGYKVKWCGGEYGREFKFYELMRMAKLGRLYYARDSLFVATYPPEIFRAFEDVLILTYMFDGSVLKPYFSLFELSFFMCSIVKDKNIYSIIPYSDTLDKEFRQHFKALVSICENKGLHKKRTLSVSWFKSASPDSLKQLKNDIGTYYNRVLKNAKASNGDIMWTCPADFKTKLSGKGYTYSRPMTKKEKELPERERKEVEKRLSCFVPCNSKATNIYGNRWALAYCINMSQNPLIIGFFEDCGVEFDRNAYALSCLIQWMCRSRVRNGQPISIYIPSKRMRDLLIEWMSV